VERCVDRSVETRTGTRGKKFKKKVPLIKRSQASGKLKQSTRQPVKIRVFYEEVQISGGKGAHVGNLEVVGIVPRYWRAAGHTVTAHPLEGERPCREKAPRCAWTEVTPP